MYLPPLEHKKMPGIKGWHRGPDGSMISQEENEEEWLRYVSHVAQSMLDGYNSGVTIPQWILDYIAFSRMPQNHMRVHQWFVNQWGSATARTIMKRMYKRTNPQGGRGNDVEWFIDQL